MKQYFLENKYLKIGFLDLGATITNIIKKSNSTDYVLHYHSKEEYLENPYYLGATVGPVAGRVYPSCYLDNDGKVIELPKNENQVHLHGATKSLSKKVWTVYQPNQTEARLEVTEEWYDGAVITTKLNYQLEENAFSITCDCHSDKPTILNIMNHSYFNLNRDKTRSIGNHSLKIAPSLIQLIDNQSVPTGLFDNMTQTINTNYNFSEFKKVHEAFKRETELLNYCNGGIDLAYRFTEGCGLKVHLKSSDEENQLKIYSDQESCVIYTLNKIGDKRRINQSIDIYKYAGITFEMQRVPNYMYENQNYLTDHFKSTTFYEVL